MLKFEVLNELTLKVTSDGQGRDEIFTKCGAWIGGECYGGKSWAFDRVLLGPEGNPMQAIVNQVIRRVTGENLQLVKVTYGGPSITYFANEAQHVIPIKLGIGEQLNIESENLLFFYNCKYGVRFLGTGVVSQKGLATSTLIGQGPDACVGVLVDGNPIVLSNQTNGATVFCDPDALCAFTGKAEPSFDLNIGIKSIIARNGESYAFKWDASKPTTIIMQPNERTSGIDIGIDGKGGKPTKQNNQLFRQGGNQGLNSAMDALGGLTGNNGGAGGLGGLGGLSGLGGALGGILNS